MFDSIADVGSSLPNPNASLFYGRAAILLSGSVFFTQEMRSPDDHPCFCVFVCHICWPVRLSANNLLEMV